MTKHLGLANLPAAGGLPGFEPRHIERLAAEVPALDWRSCHDKEEFARLLPEAQAALVWGFSSKLDGAAKNLRIISTPSAGREFIQATPRPGLEIAFGAFHGELMAETVIGMMLASVRGIRHSFLAMREGHWPREEVGRLMRPLRGSHAVILGFGHIGKWVGRMLKPFGVRLTGVNRTNLDRPDYFGVADVVVPMDRLDETLPKADHLVMILPGGAASDNVMNARRLALLPAHAHVFNIGRGNSLDLDALCDAIVAQRLAGAGLDVFPEEPLPADAPIRACPRVILLPHTSAFAPNYLDVYLDELIPKLKKVFEREA